MKFELIVNVFLSSLKQNQKESQDRYATSGLFP